MLGPSQPRHKCTVIYSIYLSLNPQVKTRPDASRAAEPRLAASETIVDGSAATTPTGPAPPLGPRQPRAASAPPHETTQTRDAMFGALSRRARPSTEERTPRRAGVNSLENLIHSLVPFSNCS